MGRHRASLYDEIDQAVDGRTEQLWEVASALHRDPETAYQEYRAADLLTGALEDGGFEVERGVARMPTAFVARAGTGAAPRVALLLEYDALPQLGHACGHNLIAAAGLGAALALRSVLGDVEGTLLAVGTPAEEGGGGKVAEVQAGVFDGVDAALMVHPGVHDWSRAPLTAQIQLRVRFHGRSAHPTGNPTEGIDALAALIELFNTLNAVSRRLPPGSHVQGIITEGGKATNIVPDLAEGLFGCRGLTTTARDALVEQLTQCAQGIALATGTTVEVTRDTAGYEHFRDNSTLSDRFSQHMRRSGVQLTPPDAGVFLGSSDIGNVSTRIPAIHPFVAIMEPDGSDHTPQFAAAAGSERGRRAMLASAKALACLGSDLLLHPEIRAEAWAQFHAQAEAER
ncbi:M20 family metallopeptidase [Streptacidiphilus sp. PB12-B1b]|uniref:amidohydrolase n=1 Tax=Streptacidiphilus sp. PB12-B1b TaxID=2705012 RepID=UPI0015FA648F|nr:amidohydrolase [Streptacidiphilus sp. PB12-B1b]QMU80365.1 M20 family metallopeptidase [Streptacidiphilus sp. PB12-B1b]